MLLFPSPRISHAFHPFRTSLATHPFSLFGSLLSQSQCLFNQTGGNRKSVGLGNRLLQLRALSRYLELFSTSSSSAERLSAVYLSSEVTTPVRFSMILAATPG
jgi:hypothetical protein